jgi:hypothetical protein
MISATPATMRAVIVACELSPVCKPQRRLTPLPLHRCTHPVSMALID